MNIQLIHGRLVRDPEYTTGEDPTKDRAKFTVAVDRKFGDESDFFDCVIFGKRAGVISKWFHKGSEILLSGENRSNSYTDKNGVKRKAWSINVEDFRFCGKRDDSAPSAQDPEPNFEELTEEIPF